MVLTYKMEWRLVGQELPLGEVLVWSGGRAVVARLYPASEDLAQPLCIDPRTDDILDWPTHWMPLPPPPS